MSENFVKIILENSDNLEFVPVKEDRWLEDQIKSAIKDAKLSPDTICGIVNFTDEKEENDQNN